MKAVVIAVGMAMLLAWCAVAHAQVGSVAPGKLVAAHAPFETQCNRCHVPFAGIPDSACLACHTTLRDRMAAKTGFHATPATSGKPCTACHGDHQGRAAQISPAPPATFDHRATTFPLAGAHAALACDRCHPKSGSGGRTWTGIATRCESCHADTQHKGKLGSECGKCHRDASWTPTIRTLKNHTTPIAGGHAKLGCVDCHKSGQHLAAQQSCGQCHAEKHGGTRVECAACHTVVAWKKVDFVHDFCTCKLPGKHLTAPCLACHPAFKFKPTPFECAACHDKERPHEPLGPCSQCHSALSWRTKTFDHNRKAVGFPITGKHERLACENCHLEKNKFLTAKRTCEGCHAVPTHGDFGPCAKCHATADWKPASFDHDKTRMRLDGKHAKVACQDCHAKLAPGAFKPGPAACRACHADPHAGQFEAAQKPALPGKPRTDPTLMQSPPMQSPPMTPTAPHTTRAGHECIDCHTTDAWTPSTITAGTHAELTGYALAGAHGTTACAGCHRSGVFAGTAHACNACHTDFRHRGRFGTSCGDCHDETAWMPVASFDHARTGFPITGEHARVGCAGCHGTDGTRLVSVAAPTACQTCHAAPHGTQFGTACTTCHSTASFHRVPAFDHAVKTDFPLELRHATLACLACHDARKGKTVNRTCRTCHGDPHRAANAMECADCHRADRWRIIRFDHDTTGYPLTGRHRVAACGDCHTNPNWTGLRTDCYACHAFNRPRTQDHLTRTTCDDCHTTTRWRLR